MPNLQTVRIFPSIGIARIGNSPEWFLGPELPFPAAPPAPLDGNYKDNRCRIRRQAQRFRLWGFFDDNTDRELTAADGVIQWTVHLANAKAVSQGEPGGLIDLGSRTLSTPNASATFANGTYTNSGQSVEVPLGEAITDGDSRLIVIGGFGNSGSPTGAPVSVFFQNPGWYDDISDGPVNAIITTASGVFTAAGAWVICPPPRYAPTTYSPITLYDTIRQAAIDQGLVPQPSGNPSFVRDIWPILTRGIGMLRVAAAFGGGDHSSLSAVIPPGNGEEPARQAIFAKLANPAGVNNVGMANKPNNMPLLNAGGALGSNPADVPPTLRPFQIAQMQRWSQGNFTNDWPPVAPTVVTPDGLTQAALENCVGAPLFPGIEATVTVRDGAIPYVEPFRFDQTLLKPGDLTKGMARPWQADFKDCSGGSSPDATAWWPAARPDSVYPQASNQPADWARGIIDSFQDMVNNWSRLGFIVDPGNGRAVETERTVVCRSCFVVTDRNEIGREEAQTLVNFQPLHDAFYVVVEGFAPHDLGITSANLTPDQLQALFPTAIHLVPAPHQMTAQISDMLLENNKLLNQAQRITFGCSIFFTGVDDFTADVVPIGIDPHIGGVSSSPGFIYLTKVSSPYMLDGPTSWLSNDVRVFKLQPGQQFAGTAVQLQNDPIAFIQNVIGELRGPFGLGNDQAFQIFEGLPADENASQLEWQPRLPDGQPVFNFALCRVRYRATVTPANDVRVFFRLFQTASTGTDYNSGTTYRRGGHPGVETPLLGIQGRELVSIPFFAEPRSPANVNLNQQSDETNKATINPRADGKEVYMYYGCWLDINQPDDLRFPIQPFPADGGPFTGPLQSIANLIRGTHQCLVAEIRFDPDPVEDGVSAASSDKLAQRNLSIDQSDNPGSPDTHRVQHTFAIHPTTSNPAPKQGPDELMISWGDTPAGTVGTLYMPGVRASEVLDLAARNFNLQTLEQVDDHTIRCKTGGVTYVPIPAGGTIDLAGLITLDLPDGIRDGQVFRIVVRQVLDRPASFRPIPAPPALTADTASVNNSRHILGAFQFSVLVRTKDQVLPTDQRNAAALRRVLSTIPIENRWHAVTNRYLDQVVARVRALKEPTDGLGSLEISFVDSSGALVDDVADIFLKHQVLSDERQIRRWPTDQTLVVRKMISTNSGIYALQALPDRHEAAGRFVTINEGEETRVQLVLEDKK